MVTLANERTHTVKIPISLKFLQGFSTGLRRSHNRFGVFVLFQTCSSGPCPPMPNNLDFVRSLRRNCNERHRLTSKWRSAAGTPLSTKKRDWVPGDVVGRRHGAVGTRAPIGLETLLVSEQRRREESTACHSFATELPTHGHQSFLYEVYKRPRTETPSATLFKQGSK